MGILGLRKFIICFWISNRTIHPCYFVVLTRELDIIITTCQKSSCWRFTYDGTIRKDLVAYSGVQAEILRGYTNRWRPWSICRVNIVLYTGLLNSSSSLNLKKCIRVAAMIFICLYANSFPKHIRGPAWSWEEDLLNGENCHLNSKGKIKLSLLVFLTWELMLTQADFFISLCVSAWCQLQYYSESTSISN